MPTKVNNLCLFILRFPGASDPAGPFPGFVSGVSPWQISTAQDPTLYRDLVLLTKPLLRRIGCSG